MIDRHAKRRADLVLPCITLSDIAAVVEECAQSPGSLQVPFDFLCHLYHVRLISCERNDCHLYRSKIRMQMQNRPLLAAFKNLLLIGIHEKRQRDAIHTTGWFDDERSQMLVRRLIEVCLL